MSLVVYNEENLSNLKNKFNDYSNDIFSSLVTIRNEINTIDAILSTPKTTKVVPEIVNYYNRQIENMHDNISSFNNDFNTIINEYGAFINDVNGMVGENHD